MPLCLLYQQYQLLETSSQRESKHGMSGWTGDSRLFPIFKILILLVNIYHRL